MAKESLPVDEFAVLDDILMSVDSPGPRLPLEGNGLDLNLLFQPQNNDVGDFTLGNSRTVPDLTQIETKDTREKKKNKNKARDERRFVLIQLRDEVEKLAFTLKHLETLRTKHNTVAHSNALLKDNGVPAVWQEICNRQLRQRLKAEQENTRLKQELEKEKQLVKSVQKLLYKRRMPKETAEKDTRRTNVPPGYIDRMAAFIFDELAAGVEIMYCQAKGAVEANSFLPTVERPLLCGDVRGKEERFLDRKSLAFSLQAVGNAWWQTWHNHRGRSVQESSSDTIVETFGLEMNDFNASMSVSSYGQQILRRNVEDHRVLYVWNAYMEPFVFDNEQVSGIYFLEQCHVFIKCEVNNTTADEGFSTSMSTCYIITPYFLTPELRKDHKTRVVVDFFVSSMFSTMKMRSEMVENLLLDQALQEHNFG